MADITIKQRRRRAVESAKKLLSSPPHNYKIIVFDDNNFDFGAFGENEVKLIRIALDKITDEDREKLESGHFVSTKICTKYIYLRCKNKKGFKTLSSFESN